MNTTSRKQREIQEREELILDVARQMLLERGYLGLTMDRIADATEYSKGTIYQHFANKEDLVAAILGKSGEKRAELFERAATFAGRSRERLVAVGMASALFWLLYPHHVKAEKIITTASIGAKASDARQNEIATCEFRCLGVTNGVVRDAIAQGDLKLRSGDTTEKLVFGLWAMHVGAFFLMETSGPLGHHGIDDPLDALVRAGEVYADGMGWKPSSDEFDYSATRDRVLREVFPEEARRLELI